jgi:hypothetical protein
MTTPYNNRPKITQTDINNGYVTRYFVQHISTKVITEIDKKQYETFKVNVLYQNINFPWVIAGLANDTLSSDGTVIYGTKHKNTVTTVFYNKKMPGLTRLLSNPLEGFQGTRNPELTVLTSLPNFSSSHAIITRTTTTTTTTVAPLESTREYQNEFAISQFFESSSITLRPDAVSFDYKTAFTLGPNSIGAGSDGLFEKVWKFRADNTNVWYSAETGGTWSPEQLLFSYTGEPIIELDGAFEQQGRPNVVVQRNTGVNSTPEVWLYWFDPFVNNFVFQNFGSGRTPRISLDDWQEPTNSDVLIFYVNDTANRIQYRVQRDRFNTIYNTPIVSSQNTYLEKVGFAVDYRYRVTYSERNTTLGTYELKQLATVGYPIILPILPAESYFVTASILSMGVDEIVKSNTLYDPESYFVTASIISLAVQDIIQTSSLYDPESYFVTASILSMSVDEIVKSNTLYDPESYFVTASVIDMGTKEILITSSFYNPESFFATASVVSIEVVIP